MLGRPEAKLLPLPIDLPEHTISVHAGDIDHDGIAELVIASAEREEGHPDALLLTIVELEGGRVQGRRELRLGREPILYDVEAGLRLEGDGLYTLEDRRLLVSEPTPLLLLGETTPRAADLAHDLDKDGQLEWLVHGRAGTKVYDAGSELLVSLPARHSGALGQRSEQGGQRLEITWRSGDLGYGDLDGDGSQELLQPAGTWLHFTSLDGTTGRWRLPQELQNRDRSGDGFRSITDVHFEDLDADGRADLLVHSIVSDGGFFGSTGEIAWYRNSGSGFEETQVLSMSAASGESYLRDLDGDGDRDLLVPSVDISFANAARALVSKTFVVQLVAYEMDERYAADPRVLRQVAVSLEGFEIAWNMHGDLDGDGDRDPVLFSGGVVTATLTEDGGFREEPLFSWQVEHDVEELLVWDLTGDGRPEVIAWAPGERRCTVLVQD